MYNKTKLPRLMNKRVIISIIITVIILGGLATYALLSPKTTKQTSSSPQATVEPTVTPVPEQKSLKDLLSLSKPMKCTFNDSMSSVAVNGTVYLASGKVRGDFSSMTGGQSVMSHMIVMDQTSYIWTDGTTTGIKMSIASPAPAASANSRGVEIDKKMDYKCDSWTPDSTLFTLPKTVKFTEFKLPAGVNTGSASGTQDTKSLQCSACNSAPAEAQAQCKAALGCP